jgi:hypothetical protein
MNKRGKKKHVLKMIYTLVLTAALLCSVTPALSNTGAAKQTITPSSDNAPNSPTASTGYDVIFSENFSKGAMPPANWQLKQTNPNQTWHIDYSLVEYPYAKPSATVNRGGEMGAQDEWLITPAINLKKYTEAWLNFYWLTCYYVTSWLNHRYIEFNISVSTDGGITWEKIWSFDDSITQWFRDWSWHNYFYNNNSFISLKKYLGQSDVRVAFQYSSTHTDQADEQYFSVDDIEVLVNGTTKFSCDAGGRYDWWWSQQYEYKPPGVRFHGSLTNMSPATKWLWDFGDGNTSTSPYFANHFYNEIGLFNLTLTCTDNTVSPHHVAFSHAIVNLFLLKPPAVNVKIPKFAFGVKVTISNNGTFNATNVNWTIVNEGTLKMIRKKVANGTCDCVLGNSTATVRSKLLSFGIGFIHITVSAYPENIPGIMRHYLVFKLGPIVYMIQET